jgi:hypothetical protein
MTGRAVDAGGDGLEGSPELRRAWGWSVVVSETGSRLQTFA